jgi:ABC-type spermidine/putrescine transport system permease subunit I
LSRPSASSWRTACSRAEPGAAFHGPGQSRVISGWPIPIYLGILWRSFWIAGAATILCLLLGFPLALFISRSGKRKNLYLSLVILPFWTSFLVRTYAWMFLLRDTGLINTCAAETRPDSRSSAAAL